MKSSKCLLCYEPLTQDEIDLHGEAHLRCSKKLFGMKSPPTIDLTLVEIEELAKKTVNQRLSVTGVQKKMSVDLIQKKSGLDSRLTLGVGDHFILKTPNDNYPEMVELEDLTMHLAEAARIQVAQHGLVRLKTGELAYLTKRFDRGKGKIKYAQEDLCQLSEFPTSEKYSGSHEKVGKIISCWSVNPGFDAGRFFDLIVFSFITGNSDLHLKNFSMLTEADQTTQLSPAYDLLPTQLLTDDQEELALTLNSKKRKLKRADFLALAKTLKMPTKVAENSLSHFGENFSTFSKWIKKGFLTEKTKSRFIKLIEQRLARLEH